MSDLYNVLKNLHRPRLLIRAARFGQQEYNRDRDLKRVMKTVNVPTPTRAVSGLIEQEADLEETRQSGDATYSVTRHVDVLIALMAEARLLPKPGCSV